MRSTFRKITAVAVALFTLAACGKKDKKEEQEVQNTDKLTFLAATSGMAVPFLNIMKNEKTEILLHARDEQKLINVLKEVNILNRFQNAKKELNVISASNPKGSVILQDLAGGIMGGAGERLFERAKGGIVFSAIVAYDKYINQNMTITQNIIQAMKSKGITRLIALSPGDAAKTEDMEEFNKVLQYIKESGIEYTIIRFTTTDKNNFSTEYVEREGENKIDNDKNISSNALGTYCAKIVKDVLKDRESHKNKVYFVSGK